jgi:hypothetical protein
MSPYLPLLSLFFKSINNVFMENHLDAVRTAARTLSLLASTIERYADGDASHLIAQSFFPLLPMVFTFYDSLAIVLPNELSILTPILLTLMKSCDARQVRLYYDILSLDNQLRFFDFLVTLVDPASVAQLAVALGLPPVNAAYEITGRIVMFTTFFSLPRPDTAIISRLFRVFCYLLGAKLQAADSFHIVFAALAFFVGKYIDQVFREQTSLISEVLTTVVSVTTRRFLRARSEAIGFIQWLLAREREVRPLMTRCRLAIEFAVCNAYFSSGPCIPFWKHLPPELARVADVYERLVRAMNVQRPETRVRELLRLYADFKDFPSIRALIYTHIVEVNKDTKDFGAAFVAQWKLCALTAEVFRLKGVNVVGVPPEGIRGFPYVVNEPPIDLTAYPPDSSYLVLESDFFTETAIGTAMKSALEICRTAGMAWVIGDITKIIFEHLEQQRRFDVLKDLYQQVQMAFAELDTTESVQVGFARILATGKTAEKLGFTDAIRTFPRFRIDPSSLARPDKARGYTAFVSEYCKPLIGRDGLFRLEDDGEPIVDVPKKTSLQIIAVKPVRSELTRLDARTFTKDVQGVDQGWSEPIVRRYTFTTEAPLPACASVVDVRVTDTRMTYIAKAAYYESKLRKFRDKLSKTVRDLAAVLPPKAVAKVWTRSVLGLSALPIVKFLRKVAEASTDKGVGYYVLLKDAFTGTAITDAPAKISQLILEIRDLFIDGIKIAEPLAEISPIVGDDRRLVEEYGRYFGVSVAFLNK